MICKVEILFLQDKSDIYQAYSLKFNSLGLILSGVYTSCV